MATRETASPRDIALPPARPRVKVGDRVEVELVGEDGGLEELAFDIVTDKQADFAAGFLAAGTPLGRTILGQPVGATVPYTLAGAVAVRILSAARSERPPAPDRAAAREAAIQEAVSKANLEDAVRLALTVDVKWGDYDPEALEAGWGGQPPT
jgi:hypothetical protein